MSRVGSKNSRWNRGRLISSHGYVLIRVGRGHPLADPRGYAYEHDVVWASAGRAKPKGYDLHHRDHVKRHNWLGNLRLKRHTKHAVDHAARAARDAVGRFKSRRRPK